EIVAAALARGLTAQGFGIVWLAAGEGGGDDNQVGYCKGALAASNLAEKLLNIPYPMLLPSAWRVIFREAARSDVILVHDALYMTSIVAHAAARAHGKPLVIVQHVGFVPFKSALLR